MPLDCGNEDTVNEQQSQLTDSQDVITLQPPDTQRIYLSPRLIKTIFYFQVAISMFSAHRQVVVIMDLALWSLPSSAI